MHDDDRAIGHRLRVTRDVLGITVQEAASAARVSEKTWLKWEAGHQMNGSFISYLSREDTMLASAG
jgi:DNA-binding XRE family transcriptional regulator